MLLRYFYDRALAQASYLVACQQSGEAIVIDPARDITPYLEAARLEDLRIAHVTETHIHADFISGAHELAAHTGAQLYLSAEGGSDWQYDYPIPFTPLHDGSVIRIGNVRLDVVHTPGHTPEHIVFILTDEQAGDAPLGVFSGDYLFIGDVGRPDLLEVAVGVAGSAATGARQQYHNMERFRTLPDYLLVMPAHGAGSACGKALGAVPSTALGYEKLFNPGFQQPDADAFADWLLRDQPAAPRYFAQMKRVNRRGAALLSTLTPPALHAPAALDGLLRDGALVIDARPEAAFRAGFRPGVINVPPGDKFSTYAGDYIDYAAPTWLIAHADDVDTRVAQLRAIGVDNLPGWFDADAVYASADGTVPLASIAVEQLAAQPAPVYILDVRNPGEYNAGHLPDAHLIPLSQLPAHLDDLPRDRTIVVHCAGGTRSQVASSYLLRRGLTNVVNLLGGYNAYRNAALPVVS